ncbi:MAG: hypothetical protein K0Q47_24 [Sedimentibacter sp.]|jgi:hypothetical protein|nr:hypothetical protein [Sedimentibacter sp.]
MAAVKSPFEIAVENTTAAIKGTKIISSEISTGTSFFEGKKRLCKILKSKNSLSIEINVVLDSETEKEYNLTRISAKQAHEKHLGTMKYLAKISDVKLLPKLLKVMVEVFKAEQAAEKAEKEAAV